MFGEKAHMEMSPNFRTKELRELDVVKKNPRKAAVLALFYPNKSDETYIVLILRNTYKGIHSAQMGFPGGKVELTDKDLEATAIRETYEEVGVRPENINILKKLTKIYIPPSNFWVYPFIGTANHTPNFVRQETEVEKIVEVSLEDFLNESSLVEKRLSTSYAKEVDVPAFLLNGHVVWGATAMMLNEVKMVLKSLL